jgi:hypothetical protein
MTKHISDETYITEDSACAEAVKRVQEEHWPDANPDRELIGGVLIVLRDKDVQQEGGTYKDRFDLAIEACNVVDTQSMIALLQRTILVLQEGS